jgi:hypothetical protein
VTVGELLELLSGYPEDARIILSKDIEGNDYSPLAQVEEGIYEPYSTWSGEFYGLDDTDDTESGERVVALWPIN